MRHRNPVLAAAVAVLTAIGLLVAGAAPAGALPAGALDPTFGVGGVVGANLSDPGPRPPCIGSIVFRCGLPGEGVIDTVGLPDGSVVVVTPFADSYLLLLRLTPTGAVDPTFGTGGFTLIGPSTGLTGIATGRDHAGRLLVSWTDDPAITGATFHLTRLLPDGTIDPGFGSAGTVTHPGDYRWVVAPDGRVHLHRVRDPNGFAVFEAVRLTVGGQIDLTYGTFGTALLPLPTTSPEGWFVDHDVEVRPGPGGSLVLATDATEISTIIGPSVRTRLVLARITGGGAPDPTFGPGGLVFPTGPPALADLYELHQQALAVQADGAILVAGDRTVVPFGSAIDVVRFLPSGTPDPSFGFGGLSVIELVGGPVVVGTDFERLVWLGLDSAGRAVVVGDTGDPGSGPLAGQRHVVRLTTTGGPDPTFGTGGRTALPADLAAASRTFAITGPADVVGGGAAPAADRTCGPPGATFACPDLVLFELRGT